MATGWVDLQVNGFLGVDFSSPDLTEADFVRVCRALLAQGTTAFLPTVITSALGTYAHNLPLIASVMVRQEFQGRLLGFHLEGPFISRVPGAVGAHNPAYVRDPDTALLEQLLDWADGHVRLFTLAAELPGADDLTRCAVERGIAVSVGHSLYTMADLDRLADAGATALTHFGNGIPNMLPRHDNPLWAGLAHEAYTAMCITDGHHLPPPVIKTVVRVKGADKFIVVSDASPIAGLPPGRYHFLDNDAILEPSGLFHNPEKQCLVGSSATMRQCIAHLASLGELSAAELHQVGATNPLALIGIEHNVDETPGAFQF
ncbi:MAG: N-acetylglucosamine-6-phosphate deacetylase [Anaerolineae bacterium]|nr:N-acetylglucosamine-6-phosphate deacetylase [Anaerolineae bacterium]